MVLQQLMWSLAGEEMRIKRETKKSEVRRSLRSEWRRTNFGETEESGKSWNSWSIQYKGQQRLKKCETWSWVGMPKLQVNWNSRIYKYLWVYPMQWGVAKWNMAVCNRTYNLWKLFWQGNIWGEEKSECNWKIFIIKIIWKQSVLHMKYGCRDRFVWKSKCSWNK